MRRSKKPMKNSWSQNFYIRTIVWLAVLAAAWLGLAPTQMGGQVIYIIVTGNSMEPSMHNGDLAILRQSQEFQIGDVILYHHPKLGPVIHRIIGDEDNRYLLQGDNNGWEDSYRPTASEITGKLSLSVPYLGKTIKGLRTPLGAAMLAGVIGFFLFWPKS